MTILQNESLGEKMKNLCWHRAPPQKVEWVALFKDIFINQKKDCLEQIFHAQGFGMHNGMSLDEYCQYEFAEFELKCEKFGLTMQAQVACYELRDGFFYFSLGKKEDKALFEAIFRWDEQSGRAMGNQYSCKIEPKSQFIKDGGGEKVLRRINLTGTQLGKVKAIIAGVQAQESLLQSIELPAHLGGNFYSLTYELDEAEVAQEASYWDKIRIFTSNGLKKHDVLMRGKDHPLFIPDLYPQLSADLLQVQVKPEIYPVIVYVLLANGQEHFYKYPQERSWQFATPVKKVCLTDSLSFDWIVNA